eukprot:symbB.v1.2.034437.t1/scaffold4445.1/size39524/2
MPLSDVLSYSFALSDACFSSDLLMQAEHKGFDELQEFHEYPPKISWVDGGSQSSFTLRASIQEVDRNRGVPERQGLSKEAAIAFLAFGPDPRDERSRCNEELVSSDASSREQDVPEVNPVRASGRAREAKPGPEFQVPPFIHTRRQCSIFPLSCWKP